VRKTFSGDRMTALDYIGEAQLQLGILKNLMSFNRLNTLSQTFSYPGGVRITVSSVFGQDSIAIDAPPRTAQGIADQAQLTAQRKTGGGKLKITRPQDTVHSTGVVTLTITRHTSPLIYIGGGKSAGNTPAYWSSAGGWAPRGIRENHGESIGVIYALSPDGIHSAGSIFVYDNQINPATINPINGSGGKPFGLIEMCCHWPNDQDANLAYCNFSNPVYSRSMQVDNSGNCKGIVGGGGGFKWNGQGYFNVPLTTGQPIPPAASKTSADGRVVVNGAYYTLDGGPPIAWAPIDQGYFGTCVVSIFQPDTVSTLAFAG
jgi:hypothetical protein